MSQRAHEGNLAGSELALLDNGTVGPTASGTLKLEKIESWETLSRLRPAWEALLAESPSRTIFLTWEWLKPWWDAYGASRRLLALAATDDHGKLAGLALFYMESRKSAGVALRVLRLLGDGSTDSDSLDLIVRAGEEDRFVHQVLDWCAQHEEEWDLLEWNTVPKESPIARAMEKETAARRWICWQRETAHQIVKLPSSWEEYLSSLSKNMRSSINTKIRRIEKHYQARRRRCETAEELPQFLEHLYAMHTNRWQLREEPGSFLLPERRQFYADMAREFLARGWLDFSLLELDSKPVAAEFGFRFGKSYYFLQSGFDPAYSSDSVGFVLKALVFRAMIQEGMELYDFLGENDPYKSRWGAQANSYLYRRCARPGSRGAIMIGVTRSVNQGKAWLRAHLPNSALKALRGTYQRFRTMKQSASKNETGTSGNGEA